MRKEEEEGRKNKIFVFLLKWKSDDDHMRSDLHIIFASISQLSSIGSEIGNERKIEVCSKN
jgi:hypothetical protein